MGEYSVARSYLRRAVTEAPGNHNSAALLETTEQVIRMEEGDPADVMSLP